MLHTLADTAAQRLGRQRLSQTRYEQAVDRPVAAYIDWCEESAAAEYAACVERVCAAISRHRGSS